MLPHRGVGGTCLRTTGTPVLRAHMTVTDGLFQEPERFPHVLSQMYSGGPFRARKGRVPRYTKYAAKEWCQECFALQHENRHQLTRVRARASSRRSISGGSDLLLCAPHASLWRELDNEDIGSRK